MNAPTTKPRYRVPSREACTEVSLDQFDDEDIIDYMRHQGYSVNGDPEQEPPEEPDGLFISRNDLDRIEMLAWCGQKDAAREMLFEIVGQEIRAQL